MCAALSRAKRKRIWKAKNSHNVENEDNWTCQATWAPLVVRKNVGTLNFCVDYWMFNAVTKGNYFPVHGLHEVINSLGGALMFSTLDAIYGNGPVETEDVDSEKAAFKSHHGLNWFFCKPFRLCSASKTFQRIMDVILSTSKMEIRLIKFGRRQHLFTNRGQKYWTCSHRNVAAA